jgi:hypothetical protein
LPVRPAQRRGNRHCASVPEFGITLRSLRRFADAAAVLSAACKRRPAAEME